MTTLYISSTSKDLHAYREELMRSLRTVDVQYRSSLEESTAGPGKTVAACLTDVDACEVYVGIFAHRYGWTPEDPSDNPRRLSMTELEYRHAVKTGKTCLIFIVDEDFPWPPKFIDSGDSGAKLQKLLDELRDGRHAWQPFTDEQNLAKSVNDALFKLGINRPADAAPAWPAEQCPYPGLRPFTLDDAPVYFGREKQIAEVMDKLANRECRFLIVHGASGSGKSSLVYAGVLPKLIAAGDSTYLSMRPGELGAQSDPFLPLAYASKAFLPGEQRTAYELAQSWKKNPATLSQSLAAMQPAPPKYLLLDQMEELFAFDAEEQSRFLDALFRAGEDGLRVVASIRADFLDRCENHPRLLQCLTDRHEVRLWSLEGTAIGDMIRQPARLAGLDVSQVEERLARDTNQEPGNLPLLAAALKRLWELREGNTLTLEAYEQSARIHEVVGRIAGEVFGELTEELGEDDARAAFHDTFFELLRIDLEGKPTRKVAEMKKFSANTGALKLIEKFSAPSVRLLVRDRKDDIATLQVTHEALFSAWKQLAAWIGRRRKDETELAQAEAAGKDWAAHAYDLARLWHHSRIFEAREAMRRLERDEIELPPAAREQLFPESKLEEMLNRPLSEVDYRLRAEIGDRLGCLGDKRAHIGVRADGTPDIDPDYWIAVPGGEVALEDVDGSFPVRPFRMARIPITATQFQAFIDAEDGYYDVKHGWWKELLKIQETDKLLFKAFRALREHGNRPASNIDWFDALAYSRWLDWRLHESGELQAHECLRLPVEQEWQQAACNGNPANIYPWGEIWGTGPAFTEESQVGHTCAVGLLPEGASRTENDTWPGGLLDMAGNVWEWCLNDFHDPKQIDIDSLEASRVLRGGSWIYDLDRARVAARFRNRAYFRSILVGFRVCVSSPIMED